MEIEERFGVRMVARRVPSMIVTLAVFSLFATRAKASATNDYDGYNCLPGSTGDANIAYNSLTGGIENTGTSSSDIVCEIFKTTSFPATPPTTNDKLNNVQISINNNGKSTGIKCAVQVYSSYIPPPTTTNATSDKQVHQSVTADTSISLSGFTTTTWWGSTAWNYAQLECTLPGGTELVTYSVTEDGTDANHYHIYSAFSLCSQADSSSGLASLYYTLGSATSQPAGYLQAQSFNARFFDACYLPGDSAQFSITPSDNSNSGWQWSYSYYGSNYGTPCSNTGGGSLCSYPNDCWSSSTSCIEPGSAYTTGYNWPSKLFPGQGGDLPAVYNYFTHFLPSTTYYYAYFKQITIGGDMEIVSVRTTNDYY